MTRPAVILTATAAAAAVVAAGIIRDAIRIWETDCRIGQAIHDLTDDELDQLWDDIPGERAA